ncbi:hypothetical protein V1514DRAFT_288489 [Lipomyces japonicus]|uniref:uncharacterized protein n=1 Tax=Lipomyces japonicus TaxID=56871 RepID=UPI0034CE4CCD
MAILLRQTCALSYKCMVLFRRTWFWTFFRSFILPVIFMFILGYAKNLFVPAARYGVATPKSLSTLPDVIGDRKLVYLARESGSLTPEMKRIMAIATSGVPSAQVIELNDSIDLLRVCKQNLRGASTCLAAIEWNSIDLEKKIYNYTLRADAGLSRIFVNDHSSDAERILMPVQWAIDSTILGKFGDVEGPNAIAYTSRSQKEHEQDVRTNYMNAITNYLSPAMYLSMIGVVYHLTGTVASEREIGLTALLDTMGCLPAAQFFASFASFSGVYIIGWVVIGVAVQVTMFYNTNIGTVIVFHLLNGFANISWSLVLAQPFRQAQLSGIFSTGVCILLAIMAVVQRSVGPYNTATSGILGFIFPPMTYVFYCQENARFEKQVLGLSLTKVAPDGFVAPGIFWIGSIFQIVFFFLLAILSEKLLYGKRSPEFFSDTDSNRAVQVCGVSKVYESHKFMKLFPWKKQNRIVAVNNLNIFFNKGEISCLLGPNGSGKTTTLEMIAGIQNPSSGKILFGSQESLGICPQKNVLWDYLSVIEHVKIWSQIKSGEIDDEEIKNLILHCDLESKTSTLSKNLSGGQKRKLQLAIMFCGESKVCCIDEVSSGLDPLSRRKIWDILLSARGKRSLLLTTHFLDEADLLGDHIAILTRGNLRVSGSSAELKESYGGGYRVFSIVPGSGREVFYDARDGYEVAEILKELRQQEHNEIRVSGPQLEDCFLKLVADSDEDVRSLLSSNNVSYIDYTEKYPSELADDAEQVNLGLNLEVGNDIGTWRQIITMLWKRLVITRRQPLAQLGVFALPIIVGGICMIFVKGHEEQSCDIIDSVNTQKFNSLSPLDTYDNESLNMIVGPEIIAYNSLPGFNSYLNATGIGHNNTVERAFSSKLHFTSTFEEFYAYLSANYSSVFPGGLFLTSPPTIAFRVNGGSKLSQAVKGIVYAPMMLNMLDNVLANGSYEIVTTYSPFQIPWISSTGNLLQFIVYFSLAMATYPALVSLYPTTERLRKVRALHYSNGLRVLPLWVSHVFFDSVIVLVSAAICVAIFAGTNSHWLGLGYLFLVMLLYGITSVLLACVFSLFVGSQLAAFALTAAYQCVYFLVYLIAYLSVNIFVSASKTDHVLVVVHYVMAVFGPIASLVRSLFLAFNLFSSLCNANEEFWNYNNIRAYGGPILYLILQSIFLFLALVWWDSGRFRIRLGLGRLSALSDIEEKLALLDDDLIAETSRVENPNGNDGLRVVHLSKRFGKHVVVDDVSFGIAKSECFALLGPNGAGKSTTFNLIRGELLPSRGEIFVDDISVIANRSHARTHLGVCPQFDAIDQMSVSESLRFYAMLRGLSGPKLEYNVNTLIHAVGLDKFKFRMASKLSGGNQRKLSLGIALISNPTVLLLDEPSSGMDAASKRVMWRTLSNVGAGRSIVLTTHSMEEADALASRAGILAKNLLAVGTTDHLRKRFGDMYLVHFVYKNDNTRNDLRLQKILQWTTEFFGSHAVKLDDRIYNGQVKLTIPTKSKNGITISVAEIFGAIEEAKNKLEIQYYSVSQSSLEQVFLNIIGEHNISEEGY